MLYVADTHALAWFLAEDSKLSKKAGAMLRKGADRACRLAEPPAVVRERFD